MNVLTVAFQKGGTGKTTTAAVLAQAAKHTGKNVLAIDLEPQGNLSFALGARTGGKGSYNLIDGETAANLIQGTEQGIDVIPANIELSTLTSFNGSARRLKEAIQPLKSVYDLIIIDTPPTSGELLYNALFAATDLIIPLQADIYNLQSLYQLADTVKALQQGGADLEIKGIVFTAAENRSTIARQMQEKIIAEANKAGINYLGSVRKGVAVKEAATLQQSLFDYAPKSKPAEDYLEIYKRL